MAQQQQQQQQPSHHKVALREDGLPRAQGLYDPDLEKDACGVGFIVNIDGIPSQRVIRESQSMIMHMEHRGAASADNETGDGAGVLAGIPHKLYEAALLSEECGGVELPAPGGYATGITFQDPETSAKTEEQFMKLAEENELKILCWRTLPVDASVLGKVAKSQEPYCRQLIAFLLVVFSVWVSRSQQSFG
ncbi:PREDICTED: ferredoxin-dependent glutamate synthase 1-like [Priapulus caudatus]|uniref:glutamate synthase (ferredoxin) n=1 Tax=Priapulus caudatus TaxID=37621 RepID=A0ABM1EA76_PRICU|nr:PREDICTED: ferredoxin-dependent glutamate synthase 1-like [Priapulus caudatus]